MKHDQITEVANVIANTEWRTRGIGESLGCLLASAYEDSPDKPEDQEPDEDLCGFTPWAVDRANEACQRIADRVMELIAPDAGTDVLDEIRELVRLGVAARKETTQ